MQNKGSKTRRVCGIIIKKQEVKLPLANHETPWISTLTAQTRLYSQSRQQEKTAIFGHSFYR
jgi:hypothetical protein